MEVLNSLYRPSGALSQGQAPARPYGPPTDPSGDGFFDDLGDSFLRALWYEPLANLNAAAGAFGYDEGTRRARRIEQRLATDPTLQVTNDVAGFIGGVGGSVAPYVAGALTGPIGAGAARVFAGASGFGAGVRRYDNYVEQAGEAGNHGMRILAGLGYGAMELAGEHLGLKYLSKIGTEGAQQIATTLLKRAATRNPQLVAQGLSTMLRASVAGGVEEAGTTFLQNLSTVLYDDETQSNLLAASVDEVASSFLQGAAGGTVLAGAVGTQQYLRGRGAQPGPDLGGDDDFNRAQRSADLDIPDPNADFLLRVGREYLTSRGNLPEPLFESKLQRDQEVRGHMKEAEFAVADLQRGVKEAFGVSPDRLGAEQVTRLDAALKGQLDPADLPEPLRDPIARMRGHIDALSRTLINEGVVDGPLEGVIEDNMGVYVHRSYRVFDEPAWARNVPQEVRNRFRAWVYQEFPEYTEADVRRLQNQLLYREDAPMGALSRKQFSSKELSVLKKKKDLPQAVRDLLGEYRDPKANYLRSVHKMASLVASHKFLREAADYDNGFGGTYFWRADDANAPPDAVAPVAGEGSAVMSPLNGYVTLPEIKAAMDEAVARPPDLSWATRTYMKALGATKAAATIGSVMTQVRNLVGNIGFGISQGHANPLDPGTWGNVKNFSPAFRAMVTNVGRRGSAEMQGYVRKMVELGVLDEDVRTGEIEDVFRDAGLRMEDMELAALGSRTGRSWRSAVRFAERVYSGSDSLWKVFAYETERARYAEALPDVGPAELDRMVASIVRNTYPTYSLVPKAVKLNRRNPLVGPFVSFPAEVMRTAYHTWRQIKTELADPRLRKIGARRLAGTLTAMSASAGVAAAARALTGIGGDEDDDLRRFMAPWDQNATLLITKKDGGEVEFVNTSYTDPYAYLRTPFVALERTYREGKDPVEAAIAFAREFAAPFTNVEILTGKLLEAQANRTATGQPIYNEAADLGAKTEAIMAHVAEAFRPGTIRSAERIIQGVQGAERTYGDAPDAQVEALAALTGIKRQRMSVQQALSYRRYEYAQRLREANRIFTDTVQRRGVVSVGEIAGARGRAEQARRAVWGEIQEDLAAARRLGLTDRQILNLVTGSGALSKRDARALLAGRYQPYRYDPERLRRRAQEVMNTTATDPQQRLANLLELERRQQALRGANNPTAPIGGIPQ